MTRMEETVGRWNTLWNLRIPTIAQVHGYCVAGGTDMALHCDMVIVAEEARIGFPAVRAMGNLDTSGHFDKVLRKVVRDDFAYGVRAEAVSALVKMESEKAEGVCIEALDMASHIGRSR